jgi:hypothetical protein
MERLSFPREHDVRFPNEVCEDRVKMFVESGASGLVALRGFLTGNPGGSGGSLRKQAQSPLQQRAATEVREDEREKNGNAAVKPHERTLRPCGDEGRASRGSAQRKVAQQRSTWRRTGHHCPKIHKN